MLLSYPRMATPRPIEGGSVKQDLVSLVHHHFKLCGFVRIVVSVDRLEASSALDHSQNRDAGNCLSSSEEGQREEEEEKKEKKEDEEVEKKEKKEGEEVEDLTMALIGSPCWLNESAAHVVLQTGTAFVLRPLPPSNCPEETPIPPSVSDSPFRSSNNDDGEPKLTASSSEITPLSSCRRRTNARNSVKTSTTKKRKRSNSYSHRDILEHLCALTHHNRVKVQGHVISISQKVCDGKEVVRAVVLLELYLPSSLWSDPSSWKPGPSAAAALSHLSCDWDSWRQYLAMIRGSKDRCLASSEDLWSPSECRVVGCKLHTEVIETVRRARFDLHSLFKTLQPFGRNDHGCRMVITPTDPHCKLGLWDIPDEILVWIFSRLGPKDLQSVAAVCRRTRELSVPIMPCLNLKLFPHQQGAVQWMLHRELNPQVLRHPFFKDFQTEDGFLLYLNCVTGDLLSEIPPAMMDFRGGLFCDEPGLGKTVTALSLILKTQGTLSQPPPSVAVHWCDHSSGDRYGYYETLSPSGKNMLKRCMDLKARRNNVGSSPSSLDSFNSLTAFSFAVPSTSFSGAQKKPRTVPQFEPLSSVKRSLLEAYEEELIAIQECQPPMKTRNSSLRSSSSSSLVLENKACPIQGQHYTPKKSNKKVAIATTSCLNEEADVWVQCDSCSKWRRVLDRRNPPEEGLAWFCNMNKDPLHQKCSDPEENWDGNGKIKSFPGFYRRGSPPGNKHNILHFASVLQEFAMLRNADTNRALKWLVSLSSEKLSKMAGAGLSIPSGMYLPSSFGDEHHGYTKIFQRFGLIQRREGKGSKKWCYPTGLDEDLTLDLLALKEALANRMDVTRLYLSRATLIVVPANLVDHWKNQILKHTKPGQLRVFVWSEQRKPPNVQDLAWNFDIIITTFSRLSSEWSSKESSVLLSIHWLRIILDEGHTLGSSLCLTNKLQMAVSMRASRRWILTGTPTPNTPNSQLSHLQPMLKFLHEGYYGQSQKVWESGILKPFEAWDEEGRIRLTELLERSMISARKSDLCNIPPCLRKVTLLDFTRKHAESYNELVVTVRRNILLADWNDPEHVESLLNPKQWKFRSNTIRNVRLSCCVAGHIKVRNAGEDIQETMDILVQEGMDSLSLEFGIIKAALLYGGNCNRCQEWCRLPILTPCRHFLCMDCVALDREKCTLSGCGNPYKMQSPEDRARPENPNPKWPVPQDLIELQPSYVQDNWDPDWEATSSSKAAYLVERLKQLKGSCVGSSFDNESATSLCNQEHRATGFCPADSDRDYSTEKAIVFSQFLEHIFVIERQLTQAGIRVAGLYSPMHSSTKMKSLSLFRYDKDCTVLLMDGSAALGLDLSFVTHVFLMEPIWDRSMEEQVVSRAHRMGATRPVLVETLAMRGTIEEQMLEFLQDPTEYNRVIKLPAQDSYGNSRNQRTVHEFAESSYLARLSFVRTKNSAST